MLTILTWFSLKHVINFISVQLVDKHSKLKRQLLVFYGLAQTEGKYHFLVEFATICNKSEGAVVTSSDLIS